eukprot:TRINITY_DN52535_c0_g1_i1.p3 TRINITY_DN52535_c0_g1~~TRINITY_DN52535_c0_g1_i1.p3  ORF type:complete len:110 (-),score=23.04 TRINITY_DN52535_c0_g1_i1:82-411(-)
MFGFRLRGALGSARCVVGRRHFAWRGCPWLEKDIAELRTEISDRRRAFAEGCQRFKRGMNFTSEHQQFAVRRFGQERSAMQLEERKIKQLEERLDFLVKRHKRHCGGSS